MLKTHSACLLAGALLVFASACSKDTSQSADTAATTPKDTTLMASAAAGDTTANAMPSAMADSMSNSVAKTHSTASVRTTDVPETSIGESFSKKPCSTTPGDGECLGLLPQAPTVANDAYIAGLIEALNKRDVWSDRALPVERSPENKFDKPLTVSIRSIKNLSALRLKGMDPATHVVVARIDLADVNTRDKMFKMGKHKQWRNDYYVVVSGPASAPVKVESKSGWKIARYEIFGISDESGTPRFAKVSDGDMYFCSKHRITGSGRASLFQTCETSERTQHVIAAIESDSIVKSLLDKRSSAKGKTLFNAISYEMTTGKSLTMGAALHAIVGNTTDTAFNSKVATWTTQLNTSFARGDADSPAWIACGIGSCTFGEP